jgi:HAE1 family hydrophobic/amphiphilic exporter-1
VTATISTYFMGSVAGVFQEGADEYDILVRTPRRVRDDVDRVKNVPIFLATGAQMPLAALAKVGDSLAPTQVERKGQRRVVRVAANKVDRPLGDVIKDVEGALRKIEWPEGAIWLIGGTAQDQKESFQWLGLAFLASILLVYMVMASQFESLLEPFVILLTVPLAVIGVALALYFTGTTVTLTALIGLVMLSGVVVNNAIVLIDCLKQKWNGQWETLIDNAVEAGRTRLRPILMTTLTTVLGLVPMAFSFGEGAELRAPLAITVGWGLFLSTLLTLVVIPAAYMVVPSRVAVEATEEESEPLPGGEGVTA